MRAYKSHSQEHFPIKGTLCYINIFHKKTVPYFRNLSFETQQYTCIALPKKHFSHEKISIKQELR